MEEKPTVTVNSCVCTRVVDVQVCVELWIGRQLPASVMELIGRSGVQSGNSHFWVTFI